MASPAISVIGKLLSPSTVTIFLQPPGIGFVPLLLTQVSVPGPGRVALDLAQTEDYQKTWQIVRNPVERVVAQNRIAMPERLALTGMLSANPLLSPLALAGAARLDKRQLLKLRNILETELSFIVSPERNYANMSCVSYSERFDDTTGNGVRLSLVFEEIRIALPGLVTSDLDILAAGVGAANREQLGAQAGSAIPDPGGVG